MVVFVVSPGGTSCCSPIFSRIWGGEYRHKLLMEENYRHKFLVMFFLSCNTENRQKFLNLVGENYRHKFLVVVVVGGTFQRGNYRHNHGRRHSPCMRRLERYHRCA